MRAYDVTKFSSNDILVGDSNGLFTVITDGQILNRRSLCESKIADIVIDTDAGKLFFYCVVEDFMKCF